jgi:hypothetical protein
MARLRKQFLEEMKMRQISTMGIFLGAAVLMLSACGKNGRNCNNGYYNNNYGYSANDPRNYNGNYNDPYYNNTNNNIGNYNNNSYYNNSNDPYGYGNNPCLPQMSNMDYRIPNQATSSFDPTVELVKQLQTYWGNIVLRKDAPIASTGDANLDVIKAGSYTWAQMRERLRAITAKCPACLTPAPVQSSSSLSIFARVDYDALSGALSLGQADAVEVQFTNWDYYRNGYPTMTKMSHVIAALLQGFQSSWGYTMNNWCNCNYWNVGYYSPYYSYIPSGTSFGLDVGYSSIGNSLSFGVGFNYSNWGH